MNDTELNRLLNTWVAPVPPPSLRQGLRAQFPPPKRRRFARPLRWVLVGTVAMATLAVGMGQTGGKFSDAPLVRAINRLYEDLLGGIEAWRATSLTARVRLADPKVYVDGELAGPLKYGHAATMYLKVPGEGEYFIISYRNGLASWVEAGHIHGSVIEFQAGGKTVRIECNREIVDADLPVFVMRRP